ncbi:DoxX family protein [Conexibacter sp. SYSU D00693]|uniref:DoxX family protein n=1 Tax=Conexibacter sp. SYSU D00693 TaxID=2812560 RepID=UPI00196AD7E1|nr:DoxX family protein [Conexibacter sp. SYSU D00693]
MNTVVWIVQGLLAAAFLAAGAMKLVQSKEQLLASGNMDWTEDFAEAQIKGIGGLEVLTAVGLVLPAVLDVAPVLVAVAAVGVAVLMLGAGATHLRRGETQMLPVNVVLAALAVFVAIERFGPEAF